MRVKMSRSLRVVVIIITVCLIFLVTNTSKQRELFYGGKASNRNQCKGKSVNSFQKIVLVSYYFGGGSYIGESLNQNPTVFYWLEPRQSYRNATEKSVLDHMTSYISQQVIQPQMQQSYTTNLIRILDCRFTEMDDSFFQYFLSSSESCAALSGLRQCTSDTRGADLQMCRSLVQRKCETAQIRAINSLSLSQFEDDSWRRLKRAKAVIFACVRDPRAIVSSLLARVADRRSKASKDLAKDYTSRLCARIHTDINRAQNWIAYETLVHDLGSFDVFYNCADHSAPEVVQSWMKQHTIHPVDYVSVDWYNSRHVADKWKDGMDVELQIDITKIATTPPCDLVRLDYPANVLEFF